MFGFTIPKFLSLIHISEPEILQGFGHVADDFFALFDGRFHEQGAVRDSQQTVIFIGFHHADVGDQTAFLDQVIGLVHDRKQEVAGLDVAADEDVRAPGLDHLDRVLDRIGVVAGRIEIITTVRKPQLIQHFLGLAEVADQDRFRKARFLRSENALQDVRAVGTHDGRFLRAAFHCLFNNFIEFLRIIKHICLLTAVRRPP